MKTGNKITWKKEGVGECVFSGYRTAWIATTKHGSLRCFRDLNKLCYDVVIWNRIIDNNQEDK